MSIPIYTFIRMIQSFTKKASTPEGKDRIVLVKTIDTYTAILIYCLLLLGFFFNSIAVDAGKPLIIYELTGQSGDGYASLANEHVVSVIVLLTLGMFSFLLISLYNDSLSPIVYVLSTTVILLNIIFAGNYLIHSGFSHDGEEFSVFLLQISFVALSFIYIARLKNSLTQSLEQAENGFDYKNKVLRMLAKFSHNYTGMHKLWAIALFPVAVLIQLVLVLFGQRPDSFIRVFIETSSFNYSMVPAPEPKVVAGDGHYLCTVSARGHKKIVKPIRAGIRVGRRITVNRQLLVANAFENILEQYIPRFHKTVRCWYDKYGYPISRHIQAKWEADIVYLLMKPMELLFLVVLYTVDKNPENRIHVQYSELRK